MLDTTRNTHSKEQWDTTFAAIKAAASDPENHTCCAHMWERPAHENRIEISKKLGVMSGRADQTYTDKHRTQTGDHKHGMIGLSCTAITSNTGIRLFDLLFNKTNTGLLFIDAPPVIVSYEDARSSYNPLAGLPNLAFKAKKAAYYGDGWGDKLQYELLEQQKLPNDGYGYLDPTDPKQMRLARTSYTHMVRAIEEKGGVHGHNEVCLNAKTEHIAAVIVQDRSNSNIEPNSIDSWNDHLQKNPELTDSLHHAFRQWTQINHGITTKDSGRSPLTIVVYRPHAENKLLHFPPTQLHKEMVKQLFKSQTGKADTMLCK